MRRDFLLQLIADAQSRNLKDFEADLLQDGVSRFRIFGYEHSKNDIHRFIISRIIFNRRF